MDLDSEVNGGVLILHQIHEGKHQYEVEKVVKSRKDNSKKMFVRYQSDIHTLFGRLITHGSEKGPPPSEDTLHPVSKESMMMNFHWDMKREEDLNECEEKKEGEEKETGGQEDVSQAQNDDDEEEEEEEEERDLLIVTMTKTSISVVRGRGCDGDSPCQGCHGTGCILSDVVMVSESSTVTLVPRGSGSFKQEKLSNVTVEHVDTHRYLRGHCSQRSLYVSPNPEKITIYYYKSSFMDRNFRGVPVVLNLTQSNCYLRCCKEGARVFLQVETCESQRLKQISKSDESTMSFVFYMKSDKSRQRKFESVLHHGWFIHIVTESDSVEMATLDGHVAAHSFLFVIQK
uniref:Interleukin-1 n=1 Tax=Stegastes partitus TaxID=144197 RepID=A0A3B5AEC3_9TELE